MNGMDMQVFIAIPILAKAKRSTGMLHELTPGSVLCVHVGQTRIAKMCIAPL